MRYIKRVKIQNFKRFQNFEISFNETKNIFIGDNESGKSTILFALDLVMSGSRSRIENTGLENLFNKRTIEQYLQSEKPLSRLPELFIELFLDDIEDFHLNGRANSENRECNGLRLECIPNIELSKEISEILSQPEANFPFEYYSISFLTFSGEPYHNYKRFLRYVNVDNSKIGSEYSLHEYVNGMYESYTEPVDLFRHRNEYRKAKDEFNVHTLAELNRNTGSFCFGVKSDSKSSLGNDLTLFEDSIPLEQKGKGRQCFIKTEFALSQPKIPLDIILLEEPENHLSHTNMRKLIQRIESSHDTQLFIATHSNLICSRIDLRKVIMLNSNSSEPILLTDLSIATAKYFMKAPDHSLLEFLLSSKTILVEGDAEYIVIDAFFYKITGISLDNANINVISVDGTSFNRYLEIAKRLGIKTAVIRDNDGDPKTNCIDLHANFISPSVKIFFDPDPERSTFEKCLYRDNVVFCDALWGVERRTLTVENFMLSNKTIVAFGLLEKGLEGFTVPQYIKEALQWINE